MLSRRSNFRVSQDSISTLVNRINEARCSDCGCQLEVIKDGDKKPKMNGSKVTVHLVCTTRTCSNKKERVKSYTVNGISQKDLDELFG